MRTRSQENLFLLPPPHPDRGLWVSKQIWLLSLICDTVVPLNRAESKRQLPQRHPRAFLTYRSLLAIVFTHPSHSQDQGDPREA